MSWWGSGGDKASEAPKDFTSADDASFGGGAPGGGYGGGGGGGGAGSSTAEMQQFSVQLQQSVMVQTIITNLSDTAFEKCIAAKPGDALSGKEAACIHATVGKMMDTNEFMMGRLAKKQQQASAGGGFQ
mmetsp:Transcript_23967/g.39647  ORF Transcript_23967/g.39647 Transcript_23967/m.39647 type:complete len:129 (-) Transcript_23967:3161-3547(-)